MADSFRQFCAECLIECAADPVCILAENSGAKTRLCQMHFAIYTAIYELPYWVELHQQWTKDEHIKRKLRPGADYFG